MAVDSFSGKDCITSEGNLIAKNLAENIIEIEETKVLDSGAKSVKQEDLMSFSSENETVRMFSSDLQNEWKSGFNCKISLCSETKKSTDRSKYSSQRVYLPCSSYLNIEENMRSKRLLKNIEDKETHSDEGVKIKTLNKIFDEGLYMLKSFVYGSDRYTHGDRVSENIYGSLRKENTIRSLGVYTYWGSSMFIFSLTKECKVVWEIYTKSFNNNYIGEIEELLRVIDHLYFYEILESMEDDFNNAWITLKIGLVDYDSVDYDFVDNLKSITFTPFSPNVTIKGPLEEINLNTILVCLKDFESRRPNINLIFKNFEFKNIFTLKRLLILLQL